MNQAAFENLRQTVRHHFQVAKAQCAVPDPSESEDAHHRSVMQLQELRAQREAVLKRLETLRTLSDDLFALRIRTNDASSAHRDASREWIEAQHAERDALRRRLLEFQCELERAYEMQIEEQHGTEPDAVDSHQLERERLEFDLNEARQHLISLAEELERQNRLNARLSSPFESFRAAADQPVEEYAASLEAVVQLAQDITEDATLPTELTERIRREADNLQAAEDRFHDEYEGLDKVDQVARIFEFGTEISKTADLMSSIVSSHMIPVACLELECSNAQRQVEQCAVSCDVGAQRTRLAAAFVDPPAAAGRSQEQQRYIDSLKCSITEIEAQLAAWSPDELSAPQPPSLRVETDTLCGRARITLDIHDELLDIVGLQDACARQINKCLDDVDEMNSSMIPLEIDVRAHVGTQHSSGAAAAALLEVLERDVDIAILVLQKNIVCDA